MTLLAEYRDARRDEDVARLRRVIALRAMVAMDRKAANELLHTDGWLDRSAEIVERVKDAYLASYLAAFGGESGDMRGAEVGAVAGEREGPLLSGVVEILATRCAVLVSRPRVMAT